MNVADRQTDDRRTGDDVHVYIANANHCHVLFHFCLDLRERTRMFVIRFCKADICHSIIGSLMLVYWYQRD